MLVPFLIMLREGIDAALIVGIVASYLKQTGRSAWMPAVWLGILLAVAASLFAGAALQFASAEFPQKAQELFEAIVGLIAAGVLTWMVFWMRKVARSIKGELHASIDAALAGPSGPAGWQDGRGGKPDGGGQGWALVGMIFFAVAREGLESVFFLLAVFQQSTGAAAPLGALLGIAVAGVLGWAIYAGDNLPAHKVAAVRAAFRSAGAQAFYLPPYSPDMNPIELAFAKLKALMRHQPARTIDALWRRIGTLLDAFSPTDCANFFRHAGYQHSM